jgi:hypothetical protein
MTSGFLPDSDFGICRSADTLEGDLPPDEGGGGLLLMNTRLGDGSRGAKCH